VTPAVLLPRDRVAETVAAVLALAREGSRGLPVSQFVRQVAVDMGPGRVDSLLLFRRAYALLLTRWSFVPDPYGEERVQSPEESLQTTAGDCDDATALVLAVARSLGLRGAAVLLSREAEGNLLALHIYAEVQGPDGWIPADLSEGLPVGEAPDLGAAIRRDRYILDAEAPPGVGFLPAILAAGLGLASAFVGAAATRSAAKEQRKSVESQSEAAERASEANLQAARVQAEALKEQARAVERSTSEQVSGGLAVAGINAKVEAARLQASRRSTVEILDFAREVAPVVLLLAGLRFLAPVATAALTRRQAPRPTRKAAA
jgi:hypothetical protein